MKYIHLFRCALIFFPSQRILRIMKLVIFIMTAFLMQVSASSFGQRITIKNNNITLKKAFVEIRKQTGYIVVYQSETLKDAKPVVLNLTDVNLQAALEKMFDGQNLTFSIKDKSIIVQRKSEPALLQKFKDFFSNKEMVVDTTVSGIVLDAQTKQPVPGAVVTLKGTKQSVQTDVNGKFRITGPMGSVLVASYLGFAPQEITIGRRSLTFSLVETTESIKEVVVNGLFTRKADTYTGSVTTFNKLELQQAGNVNVIQSLRNLDPAFVLADNLEMGSDPNALPSMTIRGATGLPDFRDQYRTDPNQPLFILDGFETTLTKIIDLDMSRIRSVTILKDAASKAIYGAQAANGVVVIETERPVAGKLRVSYNGTLNVQAPDLSSYNLTNAVEKLEVEVAGGLYAGATNNNAQRALDQQYYANLFFVRSGVNTDWLAKPLRNGIGQRHSINVSGGDQAFLYNVQLGTNNTKGAMIGSDRDVFSGNIDLTYRNKRFSFRNQLSLDFNEANNSPWGSFSQYAAMNPYLPYSDAHGNLLKTTSALDPNNGFIGTSQVNPAYNSTLNGINKSNYTQITNNFSVDWTVLKELRLRGSFNITRQTNTSDVYLPAGHTSFTGTTEEELLRRGSYEKGNGFNNSFTGRLQGTYAKVISNHSITLNAQVDARSNEADNYLISTRGFPNDRLDDIRAALEYAEGSTPAGSEQISRDLGASLSGNYSWDNRAIADFSYRTNASSQYGANSRWGSFWSLGAGWNFHNEEFIKKLNFIDNLQLRGNTGYTGSQGFSSFMSLSTYSYDLDRLYSGGYAASIVNLANPDIAWQRRYDTNLGISLGLCRKLDLTFDYYLSTTNGLVTSVTLPPSVGWDAVNANLGSLQNKGFDFRANYRIFSNPEKKSSLSVNLTVSRNKSILKEIANGLDTWNDQQDQLSSTNNASTYKPKVRFIEGQSMNSIWAVRSLGIDPSSGNEVYLKRNGQISYAWAAADQIVAGDTDPDFRGNFGLNYTYRGFNISASMRYKFGGQMYNSTLVSKVENANIRNNVDRRVLTDRWRKPGDISFFKSIASTLATQPTTRFVEDDNTLALSSLNISYDFNELKMIKAWGVSRLRLTASTSDLFELSSTTIERGTAYPFARTFQLSLNASF